MSVFVPPVITLFLNALESPYHREIHCMNCGLIFMTATHGVAYALDNEGPIDKKDLLYIETRCKRCRSPYRVYL